MDTVVEIYQLFLVMINSIELLIINKKVGRFPQLCP